MRRHPLSLRAGTECEHRHRCRRKVFPVAKCLSLELLEARTVLSVLPFNPDLYLPMPLPAPSDDGPASMPDVGQLVSYNLATGEVQLDDTVLLPDDLPSSGQSDTTGLGAIAGLAPEYDANPSVLTLRNFSNLNLVNDPSVYPWRVNVKLFMTFPNGEFVGSGTLIDPMHVLTAGHCVYDLQQGGGWATSIKVVPGFEQEGQTPSAPYGFANATEFHSYPGWINNTSFDDDIGIIDLDRPIGALTGWHFYGFNDDPAFYSSTFHNPGYPAAAPYNGNLMYTWSGFYDAADWTSVLGWYGNEVTIAKKSYSGQSGSGAHWIDNQGNRTVYAVLSNGNDFVTNFPRITADKFLNIGSIITADTPSAVDLVPLYVKASPTSVGAGGTLTSVSYSVHNYSSAASSGSVTVNVYLSTDDNITTADRLINSHSVSANLAAKGSVFPNRTDIVIPADVVAGNYFTGVILNSNDANASNNETSGQDAAPITVTGGTGAPEVVVELASVNIVDGAATPIDFGSVVQGQSGPTRVFTVRNTGTQNLTLGVPSLPTSFTLDEGLNVTIPAGGVDTFTVRLDSAGIGTKSGQISFSTNDSDENPFDFAITGQVTAVAGGPEIVVELAGVNIVDGSTTSIDFGSVVQGQTGPTRVFTVRNTGTQNLTLGAPSVPIGFTLDEGLSATILAGDSDTFTVRLDSAVAGTKSGQISFTNNDSDENPFNFDITGQVTTTANVPEIVVDLAGVNVPDGNTTPIDFGSIVQGQLGPSRVFTVRNTGGDVLTLGPISIPIGFTLDEGLSASIAPGGSDTFTVRLVSALMGTRSGQISFSTNDGDENPFNFEITGQVVDVIVAPEIAVELAGVNIVDGATTPLDFGAVVQGQNGPTRVFTVRNTGTANLTLGAVSVPIGFTLDEGLSASIAAGGSDTLTVRLDGAVVGTKSGQLSFTNNDSDENPFNFEITGQVTAQVQAPEIVVELAGVDIPDGDARPINFGSVIQGQLGPSRVFTVRNTGTDVLLLNALSVPIGFTLDEGLSASITPGGSDTFTVRLVSAVLGIKSGAISFSTNDSNENPFDFQILGEVVETLLVPEIGVELAGANIADGSATPIDFGSAGQGQAGPTRVFTVRNTGTANLTLGTVSLPIGFTLDEGLSASIAPGGLDTFTVRLDSAVIGTKSGQLGFANNDSDENPFNFGITGQVTAPDPEIVVELAGVNIVDGTATPIDFGNLVQGQTGPTRVFTVRNTGTANLTLGSVSLPVGFTMDEGLSTSIAPGASDTFTVRLDNAVIGTKSGQLSFSTNDSDENPFDFAITGQVTAAGAPAQIIDNSDATGFSVSGEWASGNGPDVGRSDNIRLAFGESFLPTDVATWTFNLAAGPGRYRVSATWFTNPLFPGLFSDHVRYEIADTGVGAVRGTAIVNQKLVPDDFTDAGSAWEDLGLFDIVGSTLTVRLFSTGDNATYAVADAIRIERVADLPAAAEVQVTMAGESGQDLPDGTGSASFGITDFTVPVVRTFVIANSGSAPLTLTGPVSVTGSVFEVLSQPGVSTLNPGQSTSFQVRMNGLLTGPQSATVSFANSDSNEGAFDFAVTGTVRTTRIIDDGDPGFVMSPLPAEAAGWGQAGGPGREFDFVYNRDIAGFNQFATWTFNVTPGVYHVSTTWPFGSAGYDEAAPFTIFDGSFAAGVVRGGRNVNQQAAPDDSDYPAGFMFPLGTSGSTMWERIDIVHITGTTLTVLLDTDDGNEFVLADSVLIDRLGDLPAGQPEIVVVQNNRHAVAGTLDYGSTQLSQGMEKTFAITNAGTSTLSITSPISITGPNAAAFQVVSGPSSTSIGPGAASTFVLRLTADYEGLKNAAITFTTNDADEGTVNIPVTANVAQYRIIDDQNAGSTTTGMSSATGSIFYQGDFSYASSSLVAPAANATWTFGGLSPGSYYVALTWFDTSGNPSLYSGNTPVTVMDGSVAKFNGTINQRVAPATFTFDGASWLRLDFFDFAGGTVTVTMSNANTDGVILADAAILVRIGGGIPVGNGEPLSEAVVRVSPSL